MRYIARDQEHIYLKCRKCKTISAYDRTQFDKKQGSSQQDDGQKEKEADQQVQNGQKRSENRRERRRLSGICKNCSSEFSRIWWYPPQWSSFFCWWPLILMTALFLAVVGIIKCPLFQQNYLFNKSVTALHPLFASILIPVLCSIITVISNLSSFKKPKEEKPNSFKVRYALLIGIAVECVFLVFMINFVIQTQYQSLDIKNADTGEVQQYYGNAIGKVASGKGRLFDSQGNLIYVGGFKDGLFDGYGEKRSLVKTIRNTEVAKSYQCVYKGEFKNGLPDGEGKEYSYDSEYNFEKEKSVPTYLHYDGQFVEGKYNGIGTLYNVSSKHEGSFFDNEFHGYGTHWFEENDLIYKITGVYSNGNVEGEATKYLPGGSVGFDGIYENDKAVSGTFYFKDGSIEYEGDLEGDDFDGRGTLYWSNGKTRYEGEWEDGWRDGYGVSYREDGTMEYDGYWDQGWYNSEGRLYYEDGEIVRLSGNFYRNNLNG